MNGFEKRREQKKEAILEAALRLFMEQGVRKVGVAQIAAQAHVSQVSIYNYFGSKDTLAHAVLRRYLQSELDRFAAAIKSDLPFQERLQKAFFEPARVFEQASLEFMESYLAADPSIAEMMLDYEAQLRPLLQGFIEEGRKTGALNATLSMDTVLFHINLYSTQAFAVLRQLPTEEQRRTVYEELVTTFLHGIA